MDDVRHIMDARWQNQNGNWYAPIANRNDDRRNLNLNYLDNDFNPNYGWLVLRQPLNFPRLLAGVYFKKIQPAANHFACLR